jgi:hypothetical protein
VTFFSPEMVPSNFGLRVSYTKKRSSPKTFPKEVTKERSLPKTFPKEVTKESLPKTFLKEVTKERSLPKKFFVFGRIGLEKSRFTLPGPPLLGTSYISSSNIALAVIDLLRIHNWTSAYMILDNDSSPIFYSHAKALEETRQEAMPTLQIHKREIFSKKLESFADLLGDFRLVSRGKFLSLYSSSLLSTHLKGEHVFLNCLCCYSDDFFWTSRSFTPPFSKFFHRTKTSFTNQLLQRRFAHCYHNQNIERNYPFHLCHLR